MKPPEIIYLQWFGEDSIKIGNEPPAEVTWCRDKINNNDIKYVRHNKYFVTSQRIQQLEQALKLRRDWLLMASDNWLPTKVQLHDQAKLIDEVLQAREK